MDFSAAEQAIGMKFWVIVHHVSYVSFRIFGAISSRSSKCGANKGAEVDGQFVGTQAPIFLL